MFLFQKRNTLKSNHADDSYRDKWGKKHHSKIFSRLNISSIINTNLSINKNSVHTKRGKIYRHFLECKFIAIY